MDRQRSSDPGGVFDFEDERFVLGHLRAPHDDGGGRTAPGQAMQPPELYTRLITGDSLVSDYTWDEVEEVVKDLESDGDLTVADDGYKMTDQGFAKLTGPNGYNPPPWTEARVNAAHQAGDLSDEEVAAWRKAVSSDADQQ